METENSNVKIEIVKNAEVKETVNAEAEKVADVKEATEQASIEVEQIDAAEDYNDAAKLNIIDLVWSIVNILLAGNIYAVLALIFTLVPIGATKLQARLFQKTARIFNIVSSVMGVLSYIFSVVIVIFAIALIGVTVIMSMNMM